MAEQDIDYDSSDKNKQTIPQAEGLADIVFGEARVFKAFLGTEFTVKLTPRGQVREIRTIDDN